MFAGRANHEGPEAMGKRPDDLEPPAYLSKSPPVPLPADVAPEPVAAGEQRDPTRYGDWERNGIAVDF